MASRTRIKKVLIIIVIAIFLMVTFGTFVMYLVGKGQQNNQQPVQNEVQPTGTVETGNTTSTSTSGEDTIGNIEKLINSGVELQADANNN